MCLDLVLKRLCSVGASAYVTWSVGSKSCVGLHWRLREGDVLCTWEGVVVENMCFCSAALLLWYKIVADLKCYVNCSLSTLFAHVSYMFDVDTLKKVFSVS